MSPVIYFFNMLGMLIWLFPPFRQYGSRYFLYFLIIGLGDLSGFLYMKYIDAHTNHIVYIVTAAAALLALQEKEKIRKYLPPYAAIAIVISGASLVWTDIIFSALVLIILNLLIIVTLLKIFLNDFFRNGMFSIFLAVLLFYEITTITKIATLFTGFVNDYFYFGTTTAIQITLGLFFSIFRYDNKKFILQLR